MDQDEKYRPRRNERRPRRGRARNPGPLLQRLKLALGNISSDLNCQSVAGDIGDARVSLATLSVSSSIVNLDEVSEGGESERPGADGCEVVQGSNYLKESDECSGQTRFAMNTHGCV